MFVVILTLHGFVATKQEQMQPLLGLGLVWFGLIAGR